MKLYQIQCMLDNDGWEARAFTDDTEWHKIIKDRTWYIRIHWSMEGGHYIELSEVYFHGGMPMAKGGNHNFANDKESFERLIKTILELTEYQTL